MDQLGLEFKNPALLEEALTHRSYLNEHPEARAHNERLEFLGDAVLELAVTDFLFRKYPEKQEGELTSYRAALVNTSSLATVARELALGEIIRLSRGEAKDTGRAREAILADALEAVIGALYLDGGYQAADVFIRAHICAKLETIIAAKAYQDAKSRFQESAQQHRATTPHYELLAERGPDHAREFVVGAYLGTQEVSRGEGKSKQEAQLAAAEAALGKLGW
ncbi:MAG: ribonuclease III [Minisyncoccia bacterium]